MIFKVLGKGPDSDLSVFGARDFGMATRETEIVKSPEGRQDRNLTDLKAVTREPLSVLCISGQPTQEGPRGQDNTTAQLLRMGGGG